MKQGDWVYSQTLGKNFVVLDIRDDLLQESECIWVNMTDCELVPTDECPRCKEQKPDAKRERYSAGVYAGKMCDDCAFGSYRDHCGLDDTPMLRQHELDEPIEPEAYYGMEADW